MPSLSIKSKKEQTSRTLACKVWIELTRALANWICQYNMSWLQICYFFIASVHYRHTESEQCG